MVICGCGIEAQVLKKEKRKKDSKLQNSWKKFIKRQKKKHEQN